MGQTPPKVYFKEGKTLRVVSGLSELVEGTLTIVVPADQDTSNNSRDYADQSTLRGGKLVVSLIPSETTADLAKLKFNVQNEFAIGQDLRKPQEFKFSMILPRDSLDDRIVTLSLKAINHAGTALSIPIGKITVYIKPRDTDTLSTSENLEFWFHVGTNFDLFDGVKAQEFFFRTNVLFRIRDRFYGQTAFYKNRYFQDGKQNEENLVFNSIKPPAQFGDTLYTMTSGRYRRSSSQTTDPLAWQFDMLHKITESESSNFFLSAGWDISTSTVTIENNYTFIDTTFRLQTARPDTVRGSNNFGTSSFPASFSYRKPTYNFNVGFMWIYNDEDVNIKTQLVGGIGKFVNLLSVYETKASGTRYVFKSLTSPYLQMRMMATYKPLGLSFGLESFIKSTEVPAFNFTVSKAFDLRSFISNLTPVTSLKLAQ